MGVAVGGVGLVAFEAAIAGGLGVGRRLLRDRGGLACAVAGAAAAGRVGAAFHQVHGSGAFAPIAGSGVGLGLGLQLGGEGFEVGGGALVGGAGVGLGLGRGLALLLQRVVAVAAVELGAVDRDLLAAPGVFHRAVAVVGAAYRAVAGGGELHLADAVGQLRAGHARMVVVLL